MLKHVDAAESDEVELSELFKKCLSEVHHDLKTPLTSCLLNLQFAGKLLNVTSDEVAGPSKQKLEAILQSCGNDVRALDKMITALVTRYRELL